MAVKEPDLDWIKDSMAKAEILKAWKEYKDDPQIWNLYKYLHLVDGQAPASDYTNWTNDHQPSLLDMW